MSRFNLPPESDEFYNLVCKGNDESLRNTLWSRDAILRLLEAGIPEVDTELLEQYKTQIRKQGEWLNVIQLMSLLYLSGGEEEKGRQLEILMRHVNSNIRRTHEKPN